MRLVLARHGQTSSNIERVLDTVLPGPGLTELGRAQAAALGVELAADGPVAGVYGSAARRAGETAGIVATALHLRAQTLEGVHEVQVGALEGRSDDAGIEEFREVFERWQDGDLDARFPQGESGADVVARFGAAVDVLRIRHPGGATAVVVTHGAALRLMTEVLVGAAPASGDRDRIDNCGRVVLSDDGPPDDDTAADAGTWRLVAWLGEAPGGQPSARDATTG